MKDKKELPFIDEMEKQMNENREVLSKIVGEMLSHFCPASPIEDPDLELTTVELADRLSETVSILPNDLAIVMAKAGFHVRLRGSKFLWQIKYVKSS